MGKEYEGFHNKFFADTQAPPPMESMGGGEQGQQPQGGGGMPPTNQSGVEQNYAGSPVNGGEAVLTKRI